VRPAVQDSIPRPARTTALAPSTVAGPIGVSSSTIVLTPTANPAAPADTVKKTPIWRGLEVASYLSADRASEEQQRLSSLTGLSGQVMRGDEDGTEVYRVVLGQYRSRSRAEKAAAWLLGEGYVTQARTIRVEAPEIIP
jgi:cell division protein FtsN